MFRLLAPLGVTQHLIHLAHMRSAILESSHNNTVWISLDCEKKLEHMEQTHTGTGTRYKHHTKRLQLTTMVDLGTLFAVSATAGPLGLSQTTF